MTRIVSAEDMAEVALLFREYAASIDTDLCFQGFAAEVAGLPGAYAPPAGALLLARDAAGQAIGCVALRPMAEAGCGEMKRLYVAPAGRDQGVGRALVEAVLAAARAAGYRAVRLDTLPSMTEAAALYRSLGFVEIPPYYATPVGGTLFFSRAL